MSTQVDLPEILRQGRLLERELRRARASSEAACIPWYKYSTFANLSILQHLLTGDQSNLSDLVRGMPVVDVGCADGEMAFLLERLGYEASAIEYPSPAATAGIRFLREKLKSSVSIHEINLDQPFTLPRERYGLAVFMGVFYHLANPLYAIQRLAIQSDFCLFSTRIIDVLMDNKCSIANQPIAYLLEESELNSDPTNFWLFTEPGVYRALKRSGWKVLRAYRSGCEVGDASDHDARLFCLLQSEYSTIGGIRLLDGWYCVEESRFRWTASRFSVCVPPGAKKNRGLLLNFYVPDSPAQSLNQRLIVRAKGSLASIAEFDVAPGGQAVRFELPPSANDGTGLNTVLEFECHPKTIPSDPREERDLGVLVPLRQGADPGIQLVPGD